MNQPVALLAFATVVGCTASSHAQDPCAEVPATFVEQVGLVLSDTTGRFFNDYPAPTPLTCELVAMLQKGRMEDSAQYHFEHLHQRYGDPRAGVAFEYITRHIDFPLSMALTTHWNPDVRIEAVRAVNNYRRIRPLVCATQERYTLLEQQDRAAVRYFIRVMETTPLGIAGSENSTIHSIYMTEVVNALDRFTGQQHSTADDVRMRLDMSEASLQQALADWRTWLKP